MARNFQNIKTGIRRYLRETNSATSYWSDQFLAQLFNASYRRRCAQLIMAHEGYFTSIATRDLVDGTSQYSFPTGFLRLLKIELVRSSGNTVPIRRWERHEGINPADVSALGDSYTPTYRPLGNGFILEPTPQDTVTNGIRIEFAGVPAELSADGDTMHPSFPEIFEELIVLDTVVACFDAEGQQESGQVRSILRLRAEMESDWERFVDTRVVAKQEVQPFTGHYLDS